MAKLSPALASLAGLSGWWSPNPQQLQAGLLPDSGNSLCVLELPGPGSQTYLCSWKWDQLLQSHGTRTGRWKMGNKDWVAEPQKFTILGSLNKLQEHTRLQDCTGSPALISVPDFKPQSSPKWPHCSYRLMWWVNVVHLNLTINAC